MNSSPNPYNEFTYFYDNQLKDYIVQFMAIFSGLQVSVGKNDLGSASNLVYVPIHYGSMDRVVAAIKADNTTNKPIRVPALAANLSSIDQAPERRKGIDTTTRYTTMPRGGVFPDSLKTVELGMPIPYTGLFELFIIASNTDQHFQMLEQILMLFNPQLQIQLSDDPHDWRKISLVELTNINFDEVVPAGLENRLIISSIIFSTTLYLAPATDIKNNFINSIKVRFANLAQIEDIGEIVNDVGRALPVYDDLVDVKDLTFPK